MSWAFFRRLTFLKKAIGLATVASMVFAMSTVIAQDKDDDKTEESIELIDQDGQKVDAKQLKIRVAGDTDIQAGDGKIIIVGKDGEKQEIDVSGAQQIIVNQSVKSIMEDGEQKQQVQGKAIIIGPDGVKREFDLSGPLEMGNGKNFMFLPEIDGLKDLDGEFFRRGKGFLTPFRMKTSRGDAISSKFMIGVNCQPVNESLRSQLQLEEDAGLIVQMEPMEDTPAFKAGIKTHDILMFADETELKSIKDLVNAVEAAGNEKRSLSITLIRNGKERSVDVKPMERPANQQARGFQWMAPNVDGLIEFDRIGPGLIIDPENVEDSIQRLKDQMEKQLQEMEQLKQKMREQMKRQMNDDNDS